MTRRPNPARAFSRALPLIGQLFGEVSKDISTLMRQEVALAKAEVTQSAKQASKGAGMFAGAGVLAAYGFGLLLLGLAGFVLVEAVRRLTHDR